MTRTSSSAATRRPRPPPTTSGPAGRRARPCDRSARGKVALITGAARGQGRAHAVRLAEEGADILAVDIGRDIPSVPYPLATPEELAGTAQAVADRGRRVGTATVDVRDGPALAEAVAAGIAELGGLDLVIANAGVCPIAVDDPEPFQAFADVVAVNLTGVFHTVRAAVPTLVEQGRGGTILLISSTAGLTGRAGDGTGGFDGYHAAKTGLIGLMRAWANWLAPHNIRVNTVHPTGVDTPMTGNPAVRGVFEADPAIRDRLRNLLPVDRLQPDDVAGFVAFLCSDEARFITGAVLPFDAGMSAR